VKIGMLATAAGTLKPMQVQLDDHTLLHVDAQPQPIDALLTNLGRCSKLEDCYVFTVGALINAYQYAGNVAKAAKRATRMAILRTMQASLTVNSENAAKQNQPSIAMGILSGVKLKKTNNL